MVRNRQFKKRNTEFWTRARVILGLHRFYKDFGFCPTSTEDYAKRQQFTGKIIGGRASTKGFEAQYPSMYGVLKHFHSMRAAWNAAGFEVDQGYEEWSPTEDWFVVESCGILPRTEVAAMLKRTVAAVKRRLYDLGRITANKRWGMSVSRAEQLMRLPSQTLSRYIKHGALPVFRGHKNIYVNPADLTVVKEFDWTNSEINPELDREVRSALNARLLKILKYRDQWRRHEIYKYEAAAVYRGRIKNPRRSALLDNTPAPPNELKSGDYVRVVERFKQIADGRVGIVKHAGFSRQQVRRKDGTRRACWMATVEFPKLRNVTGESRRIRYNIPLDGLELTAPPVVEKPPIKQTPQAIRGRQRFHSHQARAENRLREIQAELT